VTFGVLYIDEGNFLKWYDRREDAEAAVLEVARRDPAEASEFGYLAYDDAGEPRGTFVSGAALLEQAGETVVASREVEPSDDVVTMDRLDVDRRQAVMAGEERHVVPNPEGGWDVVKPGGSRASSHHDTQAQAESRAKEVLRNVGGGEAVIHGRDNKIRDKDTVAPARDPNPPRDRKH
jgi:hypothetical protein